MGEFIVVDDPWPVELTDEAYREQVERWYREVQESRETQRLKESKRCGTT